MRCQWCRKEIEGRMVWLDGMTLISYSGKVFHSSCFGKLRQVARRTGGLL